MDGTDQSLPPAGGSFKVTADGEHTVSYYAVDAAGNQSDTVSRTLAIDNQAPVTTAASDPKGWTNGSVQVTLSADDTAAGIATSGLDTTWYQIGDGAATAYSGAFTATDATQITYWSTDKAGNVEGKNTLTPQIDTTMPVTTASTSPSGWTNGSVQITLAASDKGGSGLDTTWYQIGDGAAKAYDGAFPVNDATQVTYWSTDAAGNVEGKNTLTPQIDTTMPVTTASTSPSGWTNGSVQITLAASTRAAQASTPPGTRSATAPPRLTTAPSPTTDATQVTYWSTDAAGNEEAHKTLTPQIDTQAPSATDDIAAGWQTGAQTVTVTATDTGGSGVAQLVCTVDGTDQSLPPAGGSFKVTADGEHTVSYYAVDAAGNQSDTVSRTLAIDNQAPVTTAASDPKGWTNGSVQVTLSADDTAAGIATSGLDTTWYQIGDGAATAYSGAFTATDATQVTFWSTDKAGNVEGKNTLTPQIDTIAPVTTTADLAAGPADDWQPSPASVTLSATDDQSGVGTTTYQIDEQAPQTYSGPISITDQGSHKVTFFSTDAVGNQETPQAGYVNVDSAAPTSSAAGLQADGATGWQQDAQSVTLNLLHDFFGENHVRRHCALVRIEDVTPRTDPRQIREIADYFQKNGIPWSIALVPFYVDPNRNVNEKLSRAPSVVSALHYAQCRGAAIVQHGVTHQYRGHSTDDFEFWDMQNDRPIIEDCRDYVASRLEKGLAEMHACDLYPVVFETPHYCASLLDYSVIDEYYSTEYGRRDGYEACGSVAPFFILHHPTLCSLIPENCGYVSTGGSGVEKILDAAEKITAVRDGMAGFFFHPWIDIGVLKRIVDGMRSMGYEFIDIRDAALTAQSPSFVQYTRDGTGRLRLRDRFLHTMYIDEKGNRADERFSPEPLTTDTAFHDACPAGRIFFAEAVRKPASLLKRTLAWVKAPSLTIRKFVAAWTRGKPPITLRGGAAAHIGILWSGDSAVSSDRYYATQYAWKKAFESCGIPVTIMDVKAFAGPPGQWNVTAVPSAAARCLTPQQISLLTNMAMEGAAVIAEGASPLGDSLGFSMHSPMMAIDSVADVQYPQTLFSWKQAESVGRLEGENGYDPQYISSKACPVVVSAKRGLGQVLFFAAHFSAPGDRAPTRFLFFPDLLQRLFNVHPVVRSPVVEVYFEPTYRTFISEQSIVEQWRKNGVKAVHVALHENSDASDSEYCRFVTLLHRNGIAAYCWISLPHVGERFWDKHPQWRRRATAQGEGKGGDDYTVDFFNKDCRSALLESARVFLSRANWDGINWTENIAKEDYPVSPRLADSSHQALYRDSLEYATVNQCITQLSSYAPGIPRREIIFSRRFDAAGPLMMSFLQNIARGKNGVVCRYQAQLPPGCLLNGEAFDSITAVLASRFPEWSPMVELNLNALNPVSGASPQLCGTELYGILAKAGERNVRLTLRTNADIFNVDLGNLAFAFASSFGCDIGPKAWTISASSAALVDLDPTENQLVKIDGKPWPGYINGRLFFPAGRHTIESSSRVGAWEELLGDPMRISNFTGTIIDARYSRWEMTVHYRTEHRPFMALSRNPLRVTVDDGRLVAAAGDGAGAVGPIFLLPSGDHRVRIVADSFGSFLTSWISVHLSVFIVGVSVSCVALFVMFYFFERAVHAQNPHKTERHTP